MPLLRALTALTLLMLTACGKGSGNTADSAPIVASGDWDKASNLTEAIYDVQTNPDDRGGGGFILSFYNLDHVSSSDIFQEVRFSKTPGSSALRSSLPEFTGRMDCSANCQTGTLTVRHDSPHSRLNGSVRIQFNLTPLVAFSKLADLRFTQEPVETAIVKAMNSHYLLGGMVEQYQINGGWVMPFQLSLGYSTTFLGQSPDEQIRFHGTKTQGSSLLLGMRDRNGEQTSRISAQVSFPARDSIEICFESGRALQGLGAYGRSQESAPQHLCNASKQW